MNIIFLYTELGEYFVSCVKELSKQIQIDFIHIFRWPVNSVAPFRFYFPENVVIYERNRYDKLKLVEQIESISPHLLIVSGWIDKDYIKVARQFKDKIPVVLTMDNYWLGTLKQRILCLISPFYLERIFSHIWVPGRPQIEYAKRLGFKEEQIKTGFYSAYTDRYNRFYNSFKEIKAVNFPKRCLYVGRYVDFKNMRLMCEAFIDAIEEKKSEWELWCIGTGGLWDNRVEHPQIKHIGFVQPEDMKEYVKQTGVFVLPSIIENWGVVVHEFSAAGFPLICSTGVGAASEFLQEGRNGFLFNPHDKTSLMNIFIAIMSITSEELNNMGKISHGLAQKITPENWANTVLSFNNKQQICAE
jgi:glycosyltransferase involved in cell wall biosynthesis